MSCDHSEYVEGKSEALPCKISAPGQTMVEDPKLMMIRKAVRILNDAYRRDPRAIQGLLIQAVRANFSLAQLDHMVNEDERATCLKMTAFGLLNGVLGPLTGYLVVVVEKDGKMEKFGYQKASDRY